MKDEKLLKDRKLYVIFSITLIAVMGVASITPAMPQMAVALNLSETRIGLLISAFTLPGIFLTPLAGIYADRKGRKKILIPSLFIFAIAGFAIFFTRNFHNILILRVLQGVGAASLGSLNVTLIGDFFKGQQRPAAMGFNASALSLSTATYPLVGGALAGIAWYYPFVLPLLAIPVGLFVIFGMEEPKFEVSQNLKEYFHAISKSIFKKEVLAIFILSVLTFIILYGTFLTYLPFLLKQKFNLSAPEIGITLSISSITTAIFASQVGKLTNKFGSLILLKTAFLLYFIVLLLVPNINNLYLFILPILIFGSAQALNIPSLQTVLADFAPDNQRAAFMSMNGMVLRLGQTLGPLVIGIGFTISGLKGAYYLGAFIAILGIFVLFTMLSKKIDRNEKN
ncbi:MAG: MFS transporter [Bacteroidetes bacterium]|nr:MAG: MFS transporter [Bacteroidota bacterium]